MKRIYLSIIMVSLILACNKTELPEPGENDPIFFIRGELDGLAFERTAGIDKFYQFSSFETDDKDVYSFISTLSQIDCGINCEDTLIIKIRDIQSNVSNSIDINESLILGEYQFKGENLVAQVTYDSSFLFGAEFDASNSLFSSGTNQSFSWDFGDNTIQSGTEPIVTHFYDNVNPFGYFVRLTIGNNATCNASQRKKVTFSNNALDTLCSVRIVPDSTGNGPASPGKLIAEPSGVAPFTYSWSNGSTSQEVPVVVFGNPNLDYAVTMTDSNGCFANASVSTFGNMGTFPSFCYADFSINPKVETIVTTDTTFIQDEFQFSKVTIEYIDSNGQKYSTEYGSQEGSFTINQIEEFERNEVNEATKKLHINFSCRLYTEDGMNSMIFNNGEGVIAIAYPE